MATNNNGGKQHNNKEHRRKNEDAPSSNAPPEATLKTVNKNDSEAEGTKGTRIVETIVDKQGSVHPSRPRTWNKEGNPPKGGRGRGRDGSSTSYNSGRGGGTQAGSGRGRGRTNARDSTITSGRQQQQRQQQGYNNDNTPRKKKSNIVYDDKKEQDILIAFMPLLRHDKDQEAVNIYETFQTTGDHATFVQQARQLILSKEEQPSATPSMQHQSSSRSILPAIIDDEMTTVKPNAVVDETIQQGHELTQLLSTLAIGNNNVDNTTNMKQKEENVDNASSGDSSSCSIATPEQLTIPQAQEEVQGEKKQFMEENKSTTTTKTIIVQHTSSYLPKRTMRSQPGTIIIHGASTNRQQQVFVRPRQEVEARWSIPLSHIHRFLADAAAASNKQETNDEKTNNDNSIDTTTATVQQLHEGIRTTLRLCIGLFRLGTESNYSNHSKQNTSIISKEVESFSMSSVQQDTSCEKNIVLVGRVPFYAPRTPGNVIFRMYMESNPIPTLATSSPICVHLLDPQQDLDPTLRFVLSGIKSHKGSSLGSLYTVASVLSSWVTVVAASSNTNTIDCHYYEAAGRALWGCICECRKLVENAKDEYQGKMDKLVERLDALSLEQQQQEATATVLQDGDEEKEEETTTTANHLDVARITVDEDRDSEKNEIKSESKAATAKKVVSVRKEKAHLERNWRDMQAAFASIIHTVISNEQAMRPLLRQDPINKLRMEYALWCPICESSAPMPTKGFSTSLYVKLKHEMQQSILGFIPDERVLLTSENNGSVVGRNSSSSSATNALASSVLTALTTSMHRLYETTLSPSSNFYSSREKVRLEMERFVNTECSAYFPTGSRVMVFGSSANGFGAPTSDLDMCLQLPQPAVNTDYSSDDWFASKGRSAMEALADTLKSHGMKEVDASRLTARIPVIMFSYPLLATETGEEVLLDCDISMRNPLAVLNTQFLRIYSMLDPRVPVLASVIKRWAKARRINDPKTHTRKQGMCLPNLLYTDPNWKGDEVYNELATRPVIDNLMFRHPNEDAYVVNAYFYQPRDEAALRSLQRVVSGGQAINDSNSNISCSVGVLLAEFFRYYAYEFDYKHHVISLHSGGRSRGFVEKEMKGESDGWKIGGETLGIEDPFERFYNIAHVVTGTQLRRIRKEFALAYTKISDRCLKTSKPTEKENDLLAFLCEQEVVDEGEK